MLHSNTFKLHQVEFVFAEQSGREKYVCDGILVVEIFNSSVTLQTINKRFKRIFFLPLTNTIFVTAYILVKTSKFLIYQHILHKKHSVSDVDGCFQ